MFAEWETRGEERSLVGAALLLVSTLPVVRVFRINLVVVGALFLALELVRQPVEPLVEPVSARGARRLDVPVALAQRVQAQFVSDLRSIHRVWQVLQANTSQTGTFALRSFIKLRKPYNHENQQRKFNTY